MCTILLNPRNEKLFYHINFLNMNCKNCSDPLNKGIFNSDRTKKTCPSCSQRNGSMHVFYDYPDAFGTTEKRATSKNPDGPQSYCTSCRGSKDEESTEQKYICDEVI